MSISGSSPLSLSKSATTTCGSLLQQLQEIWDEIGESDSERDKKLLQFEQECLDIYRGNVDKERKYKAELHLSLAEAEAEISKLVSALGEQISLPLSGKMKGTLKQKLAVIDPVLKDIRTKKHERIKEFLNVETQIAVICAEIAGNDTFISPTDIQVSEQDLTAKRLGELKSNLQELQSEKNLRLQRVNSYMSAIHELTVVMSLDFKKIIANINPSLANHLSVQSKSISNETLASLTSEVNSLKQLKQQRLERLQDLGNSLIELWNIMDMPMEEQLRYIESYSSLFPLKSLGDEEFKSEVEVLSKVRHPNLVMLLGSCSEGSQKLLVYEYVCYGSLDKFLSGDIRMSLNWEKRLKIALGAARGLEYLHKQNIIHRDIRPNNILITHDHESLLGDFGLAKSAYDESQKVSGNNVVGTPGYMAPEYAASGKFSTKTDVYAFGVVLLQLITGLKNTDKCLEDKSLVEWAMPLLEQKNYPRLIDKTIVDSHDFHQLFWMVELAGKCLEKDPAKRHTMEWVVKILSNIMEGNGDTCIGFNTKGNNEDDKILGTETSSSFYTDRTCSSKRWSPSSSNSNHEENERKKIVLKRKGGTPNKSKLFYEEMIH